ncbi:MAG: hypothetical protein V2B19_17085 [Pseudomonadota bacterium]
MTSYRMSVISLWNRLLGRSVYNVCQCASEQIRGARCGNTGRRDL